MHENNRALRHPRRRRAGVLHVANLFDRRAGRDRDIVGGNVRIHLRRTAVTDIQYDRARPLLLDTTFEFGRLRRLGVE